MTFDVLIAGGTVVDGSGAPSRQADVAFADGTIAAVGDLHAAEAVTRVDATGLHVAPGFVDAHVHSEVVLLARPVEEASLRQGVTTHVVGQDGFGFGPGDAATIEFSETYLRPIYGEPPEPFTATQLGEYLARFDGTATVNVATLVPNGNLRLDVLANASRTPTRDELRSMEAACARAMEDGAVGISSGLDYTPSGFASTDELVALAAVAARAGGVYVSHVRYRLGLLAALVEAIEIGLRAECPVHISHLRSDPAHGAPADEIVELLDDAAGRGVEITFDNYPYPYGCTFLAFLLPLWVREGRQDDVLERIADTGIRDRLRVELEPAIGGWADIAIAGEVDPSRRELLGKDVLSAAADAGADPVDFLCDLLLAETLDVMLLGVPSSHPDTIPGDERLAADHRHVFGSDGIFRGGHIHPRAYGGCARFVGRMTRAGTLTLEEAVRHATSAPAERFGLAQRGRIAPAYAADVVVFDASRFEDRATREEPRLPAVGVRDVWVNGVAALRDGEPTGATPGRALKRGAR